MKIHVNTNYDEGFFTTITSGHTGINRVGEGVYFGEDWDAEIPEELFDEYLAAKLRVEELEEQICATRPEPPPTKRKKRK